MKFWSAADTPGAHVNLGGLHARNGSLEQARAEYETAMRLGPWFVPAYVNLADVERMAGNEDAAVAALQRALAVARDNAAVHFSLGLTLVRQGAAAVKSTLTRMPATGGAHDCAE